MIVNRKNNPLVSRRSTPVHGARFSRVYFTKRWARTRKGFLEEHPFCAHCLKEGRYVLAVDVDHIVELCDGGLEYGLSNLQGLCKRHHAIKSNLSRRRRRQGQS